ncbi:MAG: EAL domain-containing protein [Granulosicoccus sp.]
MCSTSATIAVLTDEYLGYRKLIIDQLSQVFSKASYGTLCVTGRELDPAAEFHQDYAVCNSIYTATRDYQLSGIVILSSELASNSSKERVESFLSTFRDIPRVSLGLPLSAIPSVVIKETSATVALYEHLLTGDPAHKVAYISGKENNTGSSAREKCFRNVAGELGYPDSAIFHIRGNDSAADTYDAVLALLTAHPEIKALAAANDLMAESAIKAAHNLGLQIPNDIMISGFDDTREATQAYPAITTVRQPHIKAATLCAELMLDTIELHNDKRSATLSKHIEVEGELIVRESTVCSLPEPGNPALTQEAFIGHLKSAMNGQDLPDNISLEELGDALQSSLLDNSPAIDQYLQRHLPIVPPGISTNRWWGNLAQQLQQFTVRLGDDKTPARNIAVISAAIAAIRQHIWSISMDVEFEMQHVSRVKTNMQLQMSSCVKQSDILDTMKRWLNETDIDRCYLVKYSTPGEAPGKRAQLLHVHEHGDAQPIQSDYFDSCELLPECYKHVTAKGLLVQTPVYAAKTLFGYLLIDPPHLSCHYLDTAAQSIGNALRNLYLIEQLKHRSSHLQTTNKELIKLANYDELTELPNRLKFNTNLKTCGENSITTGETLTLFFIDLDGFKLVNDTLGHRAGDELLREVAMRLDKATRAAIGHKGFIARLGGDEFTVTITGINERERIEEIANALLDSLARPYTISQRTINISASIGMADLPRTADSIDALIKNADAAMYRAKDKGKNCAAWYTSELSVVSDTLLQMDNDMRIALSNGDVSMHYQPRVNIDTGKLRAVEALMRWTIDTPDGRKTRTRPDVFIAVAERTGFITQLDTFALDQSCRQARAWELAGTPLLVAVNISVLHLQQDNFVETVLETLARYNLSAHLLELEITESAVMTQVESNVAKLHRLRSHGIQLSIDDFGTGYSSLSYLKELPVNNLKIDKSFISDVDTLRMRRSADAAIIKSVIALGRSMDFQIIAEGIETEPQRQFLRALGCHEAQGYLFARPGPADAVTRTLIIEKPRNRLN